MNTPAQHLGSASSVYTERLTSLRADQGRLRGRDRFFGLAKLLLAAITVVAGIWLASQHPRQLAWALLPALTFVLLWIAHERLLRRLRAATRLESFYQRGMARLDDRWAGGGDAGQRFLDPAHLYARDLDIFGSGSLFELLSQAATAPGQHNLAAWLLTPAAAAEIEARQAAVRELAPRLDLREKLALTGDVVHEGTPQALTAWAESAPTGLPRWLLYIAPPLGMLWLVALVLWAVQGQLRFFVLVTLVNGILSSRFTKRVKQAAANTFGIAALLAPLVQVFAIYEGEPFAAPRLTMLTTALRSEGLPPSRAMARLQRAIEYLESSDNWFVKLADRFVFWTPLCVLAIDAWRHRHGRKVRAWLNAIGDFEALSSLANFCYERPECPFPTLRSFGPTLDAHELVHPLLPRVTAVPNNLSLSAEHALVIVSGPNMAGKSTLLRALGLNVVLAQCGAPVCAGSFALSPLAVGASITVQDSLQSGLSRFYAEIQRLKQIDDLARGPQPTLFLFDELLSGTNSHDRRVGTEALLRGLLARHAIGLVTTHDLALTEIVAALGRAANMHFGDRFSAGELHFDYRLTPGIANSTNALQLMRSIGLEV